MRSTHAIWSLGLALAVGACGNPALPPAVSKPAAAPKPAANAVKPVPAATATGTVAAAVPAPGTVETATASATSALRPSAQRYVDGGHRDPFESLEARAGSDRASVTNAKLTGVIRSAASTLALVETSDGIGYILKAGDTLADGRLLEIGPTIAVFSIAPKAGTNNNRVVLRLASD
jgi:Tfp pilus assembly protein PilP